jgi:Domain of unknown function (DUF4340)
MMKSNSKTTFALLVFFFGGLLTMWGLDRAGVRTQWEETRRADRVLPDLVNTPAGEIRRLSIDRGDEHLVLARRDRGRWQMVEPVDVAAEPARVEALVRNVQDLRKSADAGTITGAADSFGLAPPAAIVRLYGTEQAASGGDPPLATLEVGKVVGGQRYVRPVGGPGIEVVNARLLRELDLAKADWRQPSMVTVPTFQVESVKITRRGKPGTESREIRAERSPDGRWKLVAPVAAPANGPKVESLLAALGSLRVMDTPKGYVADNVKDFSPFGLARPRITVELMAHGDKSPLILHVGDPVPDEPERAYVRQDDQDDVVIVNGGALTEIPDGPNPLRSQEVADIVPAAVTGIEIQTRSDLFKLDRVASGWELSSPRKEKADRQAVQSFIAQIDGLQTSEFLGPEKVPDPQLDPPVMTIRIRQAAPLARDADPSAAGTDAGDRPALQLELGRHDIAKKTIFARVEGDRTILALPDTLMEVLPKNPYAFRDRTVLAESPGSIRKLTIRHGSYTVEVEPDKSGRPNAWRMRLPVDAPADVAAVTETLTALAGLRAEEFTSVAVVDAKGPGYGLERPGIEVEWESDGVHRLKIGAPVPRSLNYFASVDGQPLVFLIGASTARLFESEFHDHRVLSFPAARAQRIVLRWPTRTVSLRRRPIEKRGQVEWGSEPGSDVDGIDLSRISSLVGTMSQLQTTRFLQYEGELPYAVGLLLPRLRVEVSLGDKGPNHLLRIGVQTDDGNVCGAVGSGESGPVFLLPAAPWNELIQSGDRYAPIPDNPFAPAP